MTATLSPFSLDDAAALVVRYARDARRARLSAANDDPVSSDEKRIRDALAADMDPLALVYAESVLGELLSAAKALQRETRHRIAAALGRGGAIRVGDDVVRFAPPSTRWVVRDGQTEPLMAYLGDDAFRVLAIAYVRKDALRAVVTEREIDDVRFILDTFIDERTGDATVSRIPIGLATRRDATLSDGEVRRGAPSEGVQVRDDA